MLINKNNLFVLFCCFRDLHGGGAYSWYSARRQFLVLLRDHMVPEIIQIMWAISFGSQFGFPAPTPLPQEIFNFCCSCGFGSFYLVGTGGGLITPGSAQRLFLCLCLGGTLGSVRGPSGVWFKMGLVSARQAHYPQYYPSCSWNDPVLMHLIQTFSRVWRHMPHRLKRWQLWQRRNINYGN